MHYHERRQSAGGGAYVALYLKGLGARVLLAPMAGNDSAGDNLIKLLSAADIDTEGILVEPATPSS